MLNATYFLLALSSYSNSPLMMIPSSEKRYHLSIQESTFSRHICSLILTFTENHATKIGKSQFVHFQNTPLKFESEDCYIDQTLTNVVNTPIKNHEIRGSNFPDGWGHKRPFFLTGCGDVTIAGCLFDECFSGFSDGSTGGGGGIFVRQWCIVILHENIFNKCYSVDDGGAGYICQSKGSHTTGDTFNDQYTNKVDIQYCCIQNCYCTSARFGAAFILAANHATLFYASTVDTPGTSRNIHHGAQFDIQSTNITSRNVNATGGYSKYCGGMEYRAATSGFFKFQTLSKMRSSFIVAFTSLDISNLEISYCNIVQNEIYDLMDSYSGNPYPAAIHVRKRDISLSFFFFCKEFLQ
ncbi:hypothetical protein TRFO_04539 [Tritrichomonas foetus]|uniref:Uncharacterized protein n=1 Tax=Tritrichomonas foetus TaxID=1144522 RepID=A0A1J4KEM7_9EUKA|nr:hypothetical protein TRFO_04539 [Tritrichomonas foetus]|eukprot:OHT09466.1 hypothetical protein TRFO_04539 [Tritrichomonas foetus]